MTQRLRFTSSASQQPAARRVLRTIRTAASALVVAATLVLALAAGTPAVAQDTDSASDPSDAVATLLADAKTAYGQGAFDRAIEMFTDVAETAPFRETRREALRYLGRAYIIRDRRDEARAAMIELLRLEPPMIELDPEVEPPPIMSVYYEARKELTGNTCRTGQTTPNGACVQDDGQETLAIIDFRNNSIDEAERFNGLQWGMPTMMMQHLSGATQLHLIERERVQWLMQEVDMARQGYIDPGTAAQAGRLLGATNVMLGSYMVFDGQMSIWARLVEVETGRIIFGKQTRGKVKDFHELTEGLSREVAKAIGTSMTGDASTRPPSRSLDAMLAYSEALKLIEDQRYVAASEKLRESLSHDPNYASARSRLESLQPLVATASKSEPVGDANR